MNTTIFEVLQTYDYEQLVFCQEKELGLQAIIAIHDTTLGPAAGGVRVLPYASEQEAIDDVLRLARGMTYKGALAGVNLGGGKCVVRADPLSMKSEALLRALGRFIQRLGGLYIAGEDVGTNAHDMEMIGLETPHVFSLPVEEEVAHFTAFGVMQAIRACLQSVYGSTELHGRTFTVQGTGAVGSQVIKHLLENGAVVTATDTDRDKLDRLVAASPGLLTSTPEDIHRLPVDIYCPCALGAVLNERTLPELHCQIVCGAANNQLADEHCGDLLAQTGIVYAPDYLVNAGGMIAYAESRHPQGFRRQRALAHVSRIADTLERVFAIAREQAIPTYRAADWLAEQRIASVRQAKTLATAP
ncbi:MAG: Glu/Leu/Phe/Val dehydrogenase [Chloroflexi bacterium]|nr:MAG: Glu/Leu/Phe/Val dehydrogenase [Chloroflexota bacterium]